MRIRWCLSTVKRKIRFPNIPINRTIRMPNIPKNSNPNLYSSFLRSHLQEMMIMMTTRNTKKMILTLMDPISIKESFYKHKITPTNIIK